MTAARAPLYNYYYMRPENFRESLATPTATFPEIVNGLLLQSTVCTKFEVCIFTCSWDRAYPVPKTFRQSLLASWQQKLVANPQCAAVPLVAQDVISAPASQAFIETLFFSWSALLKDTHNRMEKSLYMISRAWLKVNFYELNDICCSVEWRLAGFDYLNYRLCVGNWVIVCFA